MIHYCECHDRNETISLSDFPSLWHSNRPHARRPYIERLLYSEELVQEFENFTDIIKYRLKSTSFYIAGARIPSFIGEITIAIRGTRQLANVARLLAEFGQYAGVGIKTGMGMGAMQVVDTMDWNHH